MTVRGYVTPMMYVSVHPARIARLPVDGHQRSESPCIGIGIEKLAFLTRTPAPPPNPPRFRSLRYTSRVDLGCRPRQPLVPREGRRRPPRRERVRSPVDDEDPSGSGDASRHCSPTDRDGHSHFALHLSAERELPSLDRHWC